MDKKQRKQLGIILSFDKTWTGGILYICNIVKSLNSLQDNEKPFVTLFYTPENSIFLADIKYDYLRTVEINIGNRLLLYIKSILFRKNYFIPKEAATYQLEGLFPVMDFPIATKHPSLKLIAWFPDFQHRVYPQNFTLANRFLRELRLRWMSKRADMLVLSSQDAYNHLSLFYREQVKIPVTVLPFVSNVNGLARKPATIPPKNFGITQPYFIVCNQFYTHKNHMVVFKALEQLKSTGVNGFQIVCTGRMEDYRNPGYIDDLKKFIEGHQLNGSLQLVGYLGREEQLSLVKQSLAMIQPSKFEGWNTSIEDAKAMGVQVIASDIPVHKEQLGDSGYYFNPDDEISLAQIIKGIKDTSILPKPAFANYDQMTKKFASDFISLW